MPLTHQQVAELQHIARTTDRSSKSEDCEHSRFAQLEKENQLLAQGLIMLDHRVSHRGTGTTTTAMPTSD